MSQIIAPAPRLTTIARDLAIDSTLHTVESIEADDSGTMDDASIDRMIDFFLDQMILRLSRPTLTHHVTLVKRIAEAAAHYEGVAI